VKDGKLSQEERACKTLLEFGALKGPFDLFTDMSLQLQLHLQVAALAAAISSTLSNGVLMRIYDWSWWASR
jgi:hypothetical protein